MSAQARAAKETGGGPAEPPAEPPAARASRLRRLLSTGPVRRFLSTHEVHILPHSVSHSRRARRALAAAAVVLLIFSAFWWVVPRTDVTIKAQYHEGLFNTIAVDMVVVNGGTGALSPLHVQMVVTDEANGSAMGFFSINTSLPGHQTLELKAVQFKGDEVTTNYTISILLGFDAGQGRLTKTFDFRTEEPYMNLYFEGRAA